MASINRVTLVGRLGKDPDQHVSKKKNLICTFSLATDEWYADQAGERKKKTLWHNIVCFQRLAEVCMQYLTKGNSVYVQGSIDYQKWIDDGGMKHQKTVIKANQIIFLDKTNVKENIEDTELPFGLSDRCFQESVWKNF